MNVEELKEKTWQEVKAIAESLNYEKPSKSQWLDDEVLEAIVTLSAEVNTVKDTTEASESIKSDTPSHSEPKNKYATEYFKRNKIPYCELCGAQYQHTPNGEPVCAESRKDCPRITRNS